MANMGRKKGYKVTDETKAKISLKNKGNIPWHKGKTNIFSKEVLKKIGDAHKNTILSEETKRKISESRKGQKLSEETKRKISLAHIGKLKPFKIGRKPWNYIDGRSRKSTYGQYGTGWRAIRHLVYLRDDCTCKGCGKKMVPNKKKFDVHHKIPFSDGGSNDLNNLITLCRSCHMKEELKLRVLA